MRAPGGPPGTGCPSPGQVHSDAAERARPRLVGDARRRFAQQPEPRWPSAAHAVRAAQDPRRGWIPPDSPVAAPAPRTPRPYCEPLTGRGAVARHSRLPVVPDRPTQNDSSRGRIMFRGRQCLNEESHVSRLHDRAIHLAGDHEGLAMANYPRAATVLAGRFAGREVLELCCGIGATTVFLARVATHVVAVDIEAARLEYAEQNVRAWGVGDRVDFVEANALDPSLPPSRP